MAGNPSLTNPASLVKVSPGTMVVFFVGLVLLFIFLGVAKMAAERLTSAGAGIGRKAVASVGSSSQNTDPLAGGL